MPSRRTLVFTHLDEVMPEVDRLLVGCTTVGNWSLGQTCNHLALNIRSSVEGYEIRAPWVIRAILGPVIKKQLFRKDQIKPGFKTPEANVPKPGLDDRAVAEALRAAITTYLAHHETHTPNP